MSPLTPLLPQNDPHPATRASALEKARQAYRYSYDYANLVLSASVPRHEGFTAAYLANAVKLQATLGANHAASSWSTLTGTAGEPTASRAAEGRSLGALVREAWNDVRTAIKGGRPGSAADYLELFQLIERPVSVDNSAQDWQFARQRVAGANPVLLRGLDRVPENFPVTQQHFAQAIGGISKEDSLQRALAEGRVFLSDYRLLDGIPNATSFSTPRWLFAPLALYCRSLQAPYRLLPVAIQCGQVPGPAQPVRTPADGLWWTMARNVVQSADFNWQGALAHFGLCHMAIEAILLAARRELAPNHPILLLLEPHFDLTVAANAYTADAVAGPGGIMDHVLGGTLDGTLERVRRMVEELDRRDLDPAHELAGRGVDSAERLPDYPFRDDGLLLWKPVRTFVTDYLRLYYRSDADLEGDAELQAFLRRLPAADGSRMTRFFDGGPVQSFDELARLIAGIVYRASVYHAAINYSSLDWMVYPPAMASCAASPLPPADAPLDDRALLDLLPGFEVAYAVLHLQYLATMTCASQLGHYPAGHFADERVAPLVTAFQRDLESCEAVVDERNLQRPLPYTYLKPSWIPNSIAA